MTKKPHQTPFNHFMHSFWEKETFLQSDIVIVGGGILGLSTACSLKEHAPKLSITILERGIIPTGASTRNAGFACFGSLTELLADEKSLGEAKMLQLVEMRWRGLALLDQRIGEEKMEYVHNGGYELLTEEQLEVHQHIERINKSLHSIFEMDVFHSTPSKIAEFGFNPNIVKDLIFNPFEAQLHAGKMMSSLMSYAQSKGISIITGAEVTSIESIGNHVVVHVSNQTLSAPTTFTCNKAVVCTNAALNTFFPDIQVSPGRGQVLITQPIENLKIKGVFHLEEGFYYFRDIGNRIILGGGRNIDKENEQTTEFSPNNKIIDSLISKLQTVILPSTPFEIDYTWQGLMGFGESKFPFITQPSKNVFAALGCNGMGIAISSTVAENIASQVMQS
jgi:glycine/D-amino acid oxidase-like deaminating enzyme